MITDFNANLCIGRTGGTSEELLEVLRDAAEKAGYEVQYIEVKASYRRKSDVYQFPHGTMFDQKDNAVKVSREAEQQ